MKTNIIYLRTHPCFKIDHQYEVKKYIEQATKNYVRLSGPNKLHELFFKIQENLEKVLMTKKKLLFNQIFSLLFFQKPVRNENSISNTLNIPIIKTMLDKNEIDSHCIVITVKENSSVMIESIENQTLKIIKYHVGDFDSMDINVQLKGHSKGQSSKAKIKADENSIQTKLNTDYVDFIRYCFRIFYDKSSVDVKSDIFEVY